ncbi:uncharacterized protein LOC143020966 [Oratosquilla oratoria]|uniref:uncharacterized protein LOC143020966 n=1 Tax=Oratosquilla oratoria TaxID=337810 RepID=UPI003F75F30E
MNFLLSVAVITSVASVGSGLQCYICNSHKSKHCDSISVDSKEHLQECPAVKGKPEYTLCRKVDMHLDMNFGEKHPAGNRVHRSCGYKEHENQENESCYYKSGYNTRSWVCACKGDECNAAVSFSNAQILTLLLPLALLLVPRNNY